MSADRADTPAADPSPPQKTAEPDRIGNYRVVRKLGAGGMGTVYEAVHTQIGRRAAIKILHRTFSTDPEVVARFLNEARAVNIIRHPGIVDIYEYGRLETGEAFIIMEYLDGESLAERLRVTREPPGPEVLPQFAQVAHALSAAHGKGIVHRDLKPDNIMLIPPPGAPAAEPGAWPLRSSAKVLDFGIAKLTLPSDDGDPQVHTQSQVLMGTPAYMSPEQCLGAGGVDDKSDVYSLGVILYRCLGGRLPFVCQAPGEYIMAHMTRPPPPLRERVPGLPADIAGLIHAMLSKSAAERPSMAAVAAQLDEMGQRPGAAGEGGLSSQGRQLVTGVGGGPVPLSPSLVGAAPAGRRLWPAVGAALVVVGLTGLGMSWRALRGDGASRGGPPPRPAQTVTPPVAPQPVAPVAPQPVAPQPVGGAPDAGIAERVVPSRAVDPRGAPSLDVKPGRRGPRPSPVPRPGREQPEHPDVTNEKLPVVE